MGTLRNHLGVRLAQLRKAAGLTQKALAEKARMDLKYLGAVERGKKNVTVESIERILRALGVEPWEAFAFGWEDGRPTERFNERYFLNLSKNADPAIRPLVVAVVQNILRWNQSGRKKKG